MIDVLVQVPADDPESLNELVREIGTESVPFQSRPFDGEVAWQLLVGVSTGSIPILRAWIRARADSRQSYRIVVDGVEMSGYTPREVERILTRLEELEPGSDAPEPDDPHDADSSPNT